MPLRYLPIALCVAALLPSPSTAGDFGEHKLIGDRAFKRFYAEYPEHAELVRKLLAPRTFSANDDDIPLKIDNPHHFYRRSMYQGLIQIDTFENVPVTYGDLTALAGDHVSDFRKLLRINLANPAYGQLKQALVGELRDQHRCLDEGTRGGNPFSIWFLAMEDRSHFHYPEQTSGRQARSISDADCEVLFERLVNLQEGEEFTSQFEQELKATIFNQNVVGKYILMHTLARRAIVDVRAIAEKKPVLAGYLLRVALLANAFADHYLQDMFAAGHFFADRRDGFDLLGLESRGVHDFFGRHYVTTSILGQPVTLRGDGSFTESQLAAAEDATVASLRELFADTSKGSERIKALRSLIASEGEEYGSVARALELVPLAPTGEAFSRERGKLGRSLSGFTAGLGLTTGEDIWEYSALLKLHALVLRPDAGGGYEGMVGVGPNIRVNATSKSMHDPMHFNLGADLELTFFDWFYVTAGAAELVGAGSPQFRLETGAQMKLFSWRYGLRASLVSLGGDVFRRPAMSLQFIAY